MQIVKITDLLPIVETVEVQPGKAINLVPLTLSHVVALYVAYEDAFLSLFAEGNKAKPNFALIQMAAPEMVAKLIALSAKAEGSEEFILGLPATVQLIALAKIWKLSVPDPKLMGVELKGLLGQLQNLNDTQAAIPKESENKTTTTSTAT